MLLRRDSVERLQWMCVRVILLLLLLFLLHAERQKKNKMGKRRAGASVFVLFHMIILCLKADAPKVTREP